MKLRCACLALVAICLVGCGSLALPAGTTSAEQSPSSALEGDLHEARLGTWTLDYSGDCAGRDSESITVTRLDAEEMVFDGFHLRRDASDVFTGEAHFIAPMPADARDVLYTIAYALQRRADGAFVGSETITEGGGAALACLVELGFAGT